MPPKRPATATAAAPPAANDQVLSMKDSTLFKQVLRFYEMKQYKKALKSADTILKKTPNHGETLAMKGLIFNNLKKKEEAHQLVKKGLALNVKSHVCWHVYGLLYRSESKYEDAIKCLVGETPITMADGSSKRIDEVSVGEEVLARGENELGEDVLVPRAVKAALYNGEKECMELRFSNGNKLVCTPDHRILNGKGMWEAAVDLIPGESHVTAAPSRRRKRCPVQSDVEAKRPSTEAETSLPVHRVLLVDRRPVGRMPVYDLSVPDGRQDDEMHSFVAAGVVVHNCYQNAIKRDPNNLQIMKDLSNLQIQRRMLAGFTETRRKILQLKSNNKQNWLAYAIGNQLVGQHEKALSILDALTNTTDMGQRAANDKRPVTYEESEMHLYRAMLLEEAGKVPEAIKYLQEKQHEILDKLHGQEQRAQLHLKIGELKEAETIYRALLTINPENYAYHIGLQKSLGFLDVSNPAVKSFLGVKWTAEQQSGLLKFYSEDAFFQTKPMQKASAVKRIQLNFTSGETFKKLVDAYLREKISRGIPSLFSDLESLYDDQAKFAVIGELIEGYLNNLKTDNRFSPAEEKHSESPSSFMYAAYFGAQHYDHLNDHARALALVDASIAHTATSPDTYMLKARIFKHAGDPITAYGYMDTARRLDTQDRNLNVKCVRYALRADQLKQAEDTVSLFLRDGDGLKALEDLQVCWYENNAAELHIRAKQYGKALKKLLSIDKHFTDIYEDQFDFHSYCFRKSTLRAYVDMIRWADTLRGHRFHVRAGLNLIRVYLRIFDQPREEAQELDSLAAEQNLSEEEKKEAAKRAKKAQAAARKAEEKRLAAEAAEKAAANKGKPQKDVDPDPEGLELLKVDPLVEATKHLLHLTVAYAKSIHTQTLAVQVYVRKNKFLLALRHIKKALAIDPEHVETHLAKCTFLHAVRAEGVSEELNPLVKEALEKEIATAPFGSGATVAQINSAYLAAHSSSLTHRLAAARVQFLVDPVSGKSDAVKLASKVDPSENFTRQQASETLLFLQDGIKAPAEVITAFQSNALKKYPLCVAFGAKPNPPKPIDAPEEKA